MDPQDNRDNTLRQRLTTRLLTELEPVHFALAEDNSRKKKFLCRQRRTLLLELRGYADRDGTNVRPAIETLARKLGWSRSSVFARLDDLKVLNLVIDGERIAFNKPRRRRLNLVKAAELLGQPGAEKPRPPHLPECISTDEWNQIVATYESAHGPFTDDRVVYYVSGLVHFQDHLGDGPGFIKELIRHTLAIRYMPLDWTFFHQYPCDARGCPAYFTPLSWNEEAGHQC
jgi:hypothetical protein